MLPKLLELKERQPEIYEKTAYFLEAGDWLVWLLTGKQVRSACMADFKGMWDGAWPENLIKALDLNASLFAGQVQPAGSFAGCLSSYGQQLLGLGAETAVCAACIDAHAALPAAGVSGQDQIMLVLGTNPQYFSAVWVKNEWSRFLKIMKADRSKMLIPCYRDMDAYELPEELKC